MTAAAVQHPPGRPWLSVVMPVHCGERWIDATIQSILAQADAGVEIIAVDSSPGGTTAARFHPYADRLHVRLFVRPDLPSWQAKTDFASDVATADHISWLHQDDLWLPGRLAAVRRWLREAPDAVLHLAPSTIVDARDRTLGRWHCPLPVEQPIPRQVLASRLLTQNFIATPAPVFSKAAWLKAGGLDKGLWYTADWDFWLKLASLGPVIYHERATTAFRIHSSSQTVQGSRDVGDFASQLEAILVRHLPMVSEDNRIVEKVARTSVLVNVALAAVASGDWRWLPKAAVSLLRLGPVGLVRYLRNSRLFERVIPRVHAKLHAAF